MIKIKQGLSALFGAIGFKNLPQENRKLTFYSEGKSYWPHLEGPLLAILENTDKIVCFVSSSLDDPGLFIEHPRLIKFYIGMGYIRDYFFQTLETDVMVMTMPDLNNFQVKRSHHSVHYVYLQHSLASLHMIYRNGAFNHYDTICAAGLHHVEEIKAIEEKFNLKRKNVVELGYSRLDSLISQSKIYKPVRSARNSKFKIFLVAPSWGKEGLIESGLGINLIQKLLNLGHEVVLRPHFQTIKLSSEKIKEIRNRYESHPRFSFEDNMAGQDSLHRTDIMVSDWSGIAIEYAFAFNKPVIFCDIPKKINNPFYKDLEIEPIEISIRDKIGVIWDGTSSIKPIIEKCSLKNKKNFSHLLEKYTFNKGSSDKIFVDMINKI